MSEEQSGTPEPGNDAPELAANTVEAQAAQNGAVETRAVPTREANGEIRIATAATPALAAAVEAGRRYMSVEFHALDAIQTPAGVREIRRAMVGAAALTDDPEYEQTQAELRQRGRGVRVWL